MSVIPTSVLIYGSVGMTETDGTTTGGACDLTRIVNFSDMAANGFVDYVSSSASDTATKMQVSGLDASGIQQTPAAITLTGTTPVTGSQTFQRLLAGVASNASATGPLANPGGTTGVGDLAIFAHTASISAHTAQAGSAQSTGVTPALFKLQASDGATIAALAGSGLNYIIRTTGGTGPNQIRYICSVSGTSAGQYGTDIVAVNRDWGTLPDGTTTYNVSAGMLFPILPNPVTSVVRAFTGASADIIGGSSKIYFEKLFVLNTNGTTAWTAATLIKQIDPNGQYSTSTQELDAVPCTALNDTSTVANRQTAPSGGLGSYTSGAAPQTITLAAQTSASNTAAQAQGFWLRWTLFPGAAPINSFTDLRTSGAST